MFRFGRWPRGRLTLIIEMPASKKWPGAIAHGITETFVTEGSTAVQVRHHGPAELSVVNHLA